MYLELYREKACFQCQNIEIEKFRTQKFIFALRLYRATSATLEPFFSVPGFPPASFLLLRPLLAVLHLQLDLP